MKKHLPFDPVEDRLHPNHYHDHIEIRHEHRRKMVFLTAWDDGNKVSNRQLEFERDAILTAPIKGFYATIEKELKWLVHG